MHRTSQYRKNCLGLSHEHLSHEDLRRENGERRCALPRSSKWRQAIAHTEQPDQRLSNAIVSDRDPEFAVHNGFSRSRELRRVRGRRHARCRGVLALDLLISSMAPGMSTLEGSVR